MVSEIKQEAELELDPTRIQHSGFFGVIGLIISSWVGTWIGALAMASTGIAIFAALGWATAGLVVVPLYGLTFAAIGTSRARDSVIRRTGTQVLEPDHPLSRAVAHLSSKLEIPPPLVGIYPDADMNAFAAGSSPDKAVVSFSKGLLGGMPAGEILAVAAHELGHIVNRDMRRMQYATSFQNSLTWYLAWTNRGQVFMRWCLSTIGEMMLMRLSRKREYFADATAAALVGKDRMIAALKRLEGDPVKPTAEHLAYARIMIRMNPHVWFSTHPSTEDRIRALEEETYLSRLAMRPKAVAPPDPSKNSGEVGVKAEVVAP